MSLLSLLLSAALAQSPCPDLARPECAEACAQEAAKAVEAGTLTAEAAAELCSPGGESQALPPAPALALRAPEAQAHLARGQASWALFASRLGTGLSGDISAVYGERALAAPAAAIASGGSGNTGTSEVGRLLPPEQEREKQVKALVDRVEGHGSSAEALEETQKFVAEMAKTMDLDVLKRLNSRKATVEIIPTNKKLTDLPHFAHLKGKKTFDGRLWDDVRGAGNTRFKGGVACAIPEENVLKKNTGGYRRLYVLAHEFSHLVHLQGLDAKTTAAVKEAYDASMKRKEKTGLGNYADSNEHEYFAQGAGAYLGTGNNGTILDAKGVEKVNPALHALLQKIYGPR